MTKQEMNRKITEYSVKSGIEVIGHYLVKEFVWGLILDGRSEGTCEECGEVFPMIRKDQKFCKRACKRQAHNKLRKTQDVGKDYEQ